MKHPICGSALALMLVGATVTGPAIAANDDMMTTLPNGAHPISDYYNQSVYDEKDNKIGDVSDLLVENGGKVNTAMLGVGGFLGVGEKNVAVPFESLKVVEKDGKRYIVLHTTKEALQSAPGYVYDRSKSQWLPAPKQG
jgi:sporulation protein YlmC with PRC-barrel domain